MDGDWCGCRDGGALWMCVDDLVRGRDRKMGSVCWHHVLIFARELIGEVHHRWMRQQGREIAQI